MKMDRKLCPMLSIKGPQKLSLLFLSKIDNIISTTFFKTLLQQSLEISLLLFADLLKAGFPVNEMIEGIKMNLI